MGFPTVPSRASIVLPGTWREGGTFAATKGESSVAPYASRGRTPNFSSNAFVTSVVSFSAAQKQLRALKSHLGRYGEYRFSGK